MSLLNKDPSTLVASNSSVATTNTSFVQVKTHTNWQAVRLTLSLERCSMLYALEKQVQVQTTQTRETHKCDKCLAGEGRPAWIHNPFQVEGHSF